MTLPTDTIVPGEPLAVQDLSGIESVLARMWRVAEESAVDEHGKSQPLVRISLGNLIVVCSSAQCAHHSEILDRLSVRRPSRIVVVGIEPANQGAVDAARVHAHIHAVCHRPSPDSPHLCCEHIQLHFGPETIPMLSGIVSPLLEADLPSLLWWNRSWSGYEDEFARNARAVGSLLLDLERISTYRELGSIMGRIEGVALHDLAWARIEPWRRELARVFNDPAMTPLLAKIREVTIRSDGTHADRPPALGLLLLGWLAAQLGWAEGPPLKGTGPAWNASVGAPDGPVELHLDRAESDGSRVEPTLRSVTLGAPGGDKVELLADDATGCITVRVTVSRSCPLPRRVSGSSPPADVVIGAALESASASNPVYEKALKRALALAGC